MGSPPRSDTIRTLFWVAALLILIAAGARFIHLEADFPVQLTKSGAPLSDEGWHSNAAARYWLFDYWYLPGDVNRVIMQPTFQLLQWISFGALGVGLTSARLVPVLLFLGLVALMASTIRTETGPTGALIAAALLSTDFHLFAYSRIALIDLPMLFFVIAALWLLVTLGPKRSLVGGLMAGLVFSLALLTKPSALFAAPILLLTALLGSEGWRDKWKQSLAFLAGTILLTGSHHLIAMWFFRRDQPAHWQLISSKIKFEGMGLWERTWTGIKVMGGRDVLLCIALLLSVAIVAQHWRRNGLASQRVAVFFMLGTAGSFAVIASSHYQPARYFTPLIALSIGVVSLATAIALSNHWRPVSALLVSLVALHIGVGTFRIVDYLAHPKWSYREFCKELRSDLEKSDRLLLMGDMAPQVTLATGIEAISGLVGSQPAVLRFQEYRPTHLITRSPFTDRLTAAVGSKAKLELVKTYDVMENYYEGPVHLHEVVQELE